MKLADEIDKQKPKGQIDTHKPICLGQRVKAAEGLSNLSLA
jgi:hypothetical protein